VVADPRAVAARWPDLRIRMLAVLAVAVTESPWVLARSTRALCHDAGLTDDEILHAVALAAYFGHLNRIADATGVPLDYAVRLVPPQLEHAVPPFQRAPGAVGGPPAIVIEARTATATALAAWQRYVFQDCTGPLSSTQRALIARRVGVLVGDRADEPAPAAPLEQALVELVDRVTLAPWRLDDAYAALRAFGFDDRALFDACVAASTANVVTRIAVALACLGQ
jgi:alkylhydroperoxidase family enzyme